MKVTIRLDDITPDMDWGKFRRFESLLDELNIKPIIGVVPKNEDETLHVEKSHPEFWDEIRRLKNKGWVIAMHGYNHVYTTGKGGLVPLNKFSEFAGVDYETQLSKITAGRNTFLAEDIVPVVFMAPGHTFDKSTVKALRDNKFIGITDGFGRKPYKRNGIIYYPIAEKRSKVFNDRREGRTTLVYHLNTLTYEQIIEDEAKLLRNNKDKLESFTLVDDAVPQTLFERVIEYLKSSAKRIIVSIR